MSATGAPRDEAGVAVIGAGWAGLAAAVRLAEGGRRVEVFESAREPGGRARTVNLGGLAVDNGPHLLLGAYRETLALIHTVNPRAREQLLRRPLRWRMEPGFALQTAPLPAPWHLALGLFTARGLSLGERWRVVRFLSAMRRLDFRLPRDLPLSEWLSRHGQNGHVNRLLWHPLCLAALNTPPEAASAQVFLNVLRDAFARRRGDSDLLLPMVGLSALFPEPAAAYVCRRGGAVHTGRRVTAVAAEKTGFVLSAGGETRRFRQVVCALPPQRSAALLETLTGLGATAAQIRALGQEPIYSLYLQYPAATRLPEPMLGLAEGPGHWVFDRGQLGGPPGLLAVVISARGTHQALDHETLARQVAQQLRRVLGLVPSPLWARVVAEKRATFSCVPGVARPAFRTPLENFYLAGDYVAGDYPATLEGAVRSGIQCARHILESP